MDLPVLPTVAFDNSIVGYLSLFLTIVLPILVGMVAKRSWSPAVKATLLMFFAAVVSVVEGFIFADQSHTSFNLQGAVILALIRFAVAVSIHFGYYKPAGVSEFVQRNVGFTDKYATVGHGQ